MQADHLADRRWRQALEETAQGRLIREPFQSDQRKKQSVVVQDLGFVDPLKTRNQDEEQRQDHVLGSILDPMRSGLKDTLEATAQPQLVTKSLDQEQSTEVSQ